MIAIDRRRYMYRKDSYKAIDLGLPSGTLWADRNVGAENIEDAGLYFSWGNTDGHAAGDGYNFSDATYANTEGSKITTDLPLSHDAARVNMGGDWRMPTQDEFTELLNNCKVEKTTLNGVNGYVFTSSINKKQVFFPRCGSMDGTVLKWLNQTGYYRTTNRTIILLLQESGYRVFGSDFRLYGFSVRAVK